MFLKIYKKYSFKIKKPVIEFHGLTIKQNTQNPTSMLSNMRNRLLIKKVLEIKEDKK
jgi:hypothetical protein